MNKKLSMSYILIAALTLCVAALMLGCRGKSDQPDGTGQGTQASNSQTTDGTSGESITDEADDLTTNETTINSDEPEIDIPISPSIFIGTVEGEGAEDLDDEPDDPVPTQPDKPATPTQGNQNSDEEIDVAELTYETFWQLDGDQQKTVIDMFSTYDDFLKWYKAILAQYKAEHPDVEIGNDGIVDLSP